MPHLVYLKLDVEDMVAGWDLYEAWFSVCRTGSDEERAQFYEHWQFVRDHFDCQCGRMAPRGMKVMVGDANYLW